MNQRYASMIDHTLLKADATKEQIKKLCEEAKEYGFASICVNPTWVKYVCEQLSNSNVKVCTVVGFPLGATTSAVKAFETQNAIENGAKEIDMVINIAALKDGNDQFVLDDIEAVVQAAKGNTVKVIIETCLLTTEEKIRACELAKKASAQFVKTSTGFSTGGADVSDIQLMRKTVGSELGVKASGGIRNLEDLEKMIQSGATRIGASSGVHIMNEIHQIKIIK